MHLWSKTARKVSSDTIRGGMDDSDRPSVLGLQSATDAAGNWLRNAIMMGRFKPGDRLIELGLAKTLGIGQPTVREALKELELQGFVRKVPKHGTYVTQLDQRDFSEILETRVALEEVAVRRATLLAVSTDLKELRGWTKGMVAAAKAFDRDLFHSLDMKFHRRLWELSGNSFLERALERVAFAPFAFFILQRRREETKSFLAAAELHKPIIDGMETGDPDRAASAYRTATLSFWKEHHGVEIQTPGGSVMAALVAK